MCVYVNREMLHYSRRRCSEALQAAVRDANRLSLLAFRLYFQLAKMFSDGTCLLRKNLNYFQKTYHISYFILSVADDLIPLLYQTPLSHAASIILQLLCWNSRLKWSVIMYLLTSNSSTSVFGTAPSIEIKLFMFKPSTLSSIIDNIHMFRSCYKSKSVLTMWSNLVISQIFGVCKCVNLIEGYHVHMWS